MFRWNWDNVVINVRKDWFNLTTWQYVGNGNSQSSNIQW